VRELRNAMEQAALLAPPGGEVGLRELPFVTGTPDAARPEAGAGESPDDLNLERAERRNIERALERTQRNVTQAARLLGISRDTLRYRLERLGLRSESPTEEAP
jgi:two-component system response regulator AtoC